MQYHIPLRIHGDILHAISVNANIRLTKAVFCCGPVGVTGNVVGSTLATNLYSGADDGNRTRVICLEGRGSTIELHPRTPEGDTDDPRRQTSSVRDI